VVKLDAGAIEKGVLTMTLQIMAVQGHATWWKWTISTAAGVLKEQSTMQFRSAAAAEAHGRARLAELQHAGRPLPS
jgi:hypothetical protein